MADSPPTPPTGLTDDEQQTLRTLLDGRSPGELERVADYVAGLAAYRNPEARRAEAEEREESAEPATEEGEPNVREPAPDDVPADDVPADDVPADVPSKATRTVKTINDNRYYYWQWRDGDAIKSQYIGPAGDGDSDT